MISPPAALHALLFATGEPTEKKRLAKLLELSECEFAVVLKSLSESLHGSGVMVVEAGDMLELRTAPEASAIVKKLRENELSRDLGKGSLETLAVIAYRKGGVTRSDIDWVRGVNSSASVRTLLMRGLIEGKEDPEDKRRIRYEITTEALSHLGVARIEDLPRADELSPETETALEEKDQQTPDSENT